MTIRTCETAFGGNSLCEFFLLSKCDGSINTDGNPFFLFAASGVEGPVLNLTNINREHMGEYVCYADNGVTPWQQRSFIVEVHCNPLFYVPLISLSL